MIDFFAEIEKGKNYKTDRDKGEAVVLVKNVSKKFCKSLKRSMAYGIIDLSKNLLGIKTDLTDLKKDEFWAIDDVSFELRRGDVLGLIGVNGSGKTTLLRLLAGIFPPDKGEIAIRGRVGALIALGAGFHPHMSGRENIYLNGTILGMNREEIDNKFNDIVAFAELWEFLDAPVSTYSSGMRVRLGFSIAMAIQPDLLLIDEVLAVGDLGFKMKCLNAIGDLVKSSAVIFVSHSMPFVARICTQAMILDKGITKYHTKDVGKAIDSYFSMFEIGEAKVSGTDKAFLHNIELNDKSTRGDKIVVKHGEDLRIKMQISIQPSVPEAYISVVIWNQELRPVLHCSSKHSNFSVSGSEKLSEITLKLDNVQLNAGKHTLAVLVNAVDSDEILLRVDNAAYFQVKLFSPSWADFIGIGEWKKSL